MFRAEPVDKKSKGRTWMRMENAILLASRLLGQAAGFAVGSLALLTGADVFCRRVLNKPILGALEIAEVVFVAANFLVFSVIHSQGREIRLDLLSRRFHGRFGHLLDMFASGCSMLVFGFILWGGCQRFWEAWTLDEYGMGRIAIPTIIPYGVLVLGSILMVVVLILSFLKSLGALFYRSEN
jgi:TRAP-type C4-dicarboxylate transport system permease small subunit